MKKNWNAGAILRSAFLLVSAAVAAATLSAAAYAAAPEPKPPELSDGDKTFAYSGDTEWTDALLPIARDADLFVCECYGHAGRLTGHLSFETLRDKLGVLGAKRTMITHMNPAMLAKIDEAKAAGVMVAEEGMRLEI